METKTKKNVKCGQYYKWHYAHRHGVVRVSWKEMIVEVCKCVTAVWRRDDVNTKTVLMGKASSVFLVCVLKVHLTLSETARCPNNGIKEKDRCR